MHIYICTCIQHSSQINVERTIKYKEISVVRRVGIKVPLKMFLLCSLMYSWRAENPCVMPHNLV